MATQITVNSATNVANVTIATSPTINVAISRAAVNNVNISNVANANYANYAGSAATVDGYIKVPFAYNNPSPKNVAIVPANAVVSQVDVIVTTAFNDPAATLSLGTVANANLLVSTTDCKPSQIGTYAATPGQLFLSNAWTVLTINPGTSTTGSGMIVIYF